MTGPSKKHITLTEVCVVIALFILLIFGIKFLLQKIMESEPVVSSQNFIHDKEDLFKQNIRDINDSVHESIDETQYSISDKMPWLHLKARPPIPEIKDETPAPSENSLTIDRTINLNNQDVTKNPDAKTQ